MACRRASDSPSWRGDELADAVLGDEAQHAAGHGLAGHELGDHERAADELAVLAGEVDVGHGDAGLLGQGAHAGLGVDRVDDRLAERDDRRHEVVHRAAGLGVEQHVVPAGPGRRRRQVADV